MNDKCGMNRRMFLKTAAGACLAAGFARADDAGTATPDWRPSVRWRGFNLLGMFRAPTQGLAPDPRVDGHFNAWEFEALHDWGFNFARLPLDYRILIRDDDWTKLDEAKMKRLDEAIAWGRQTGVHVQIALHRIPGYCVLDRTEPFPLGTSEVAQEAACRMWAAMARRWRGVPNEALSFNLFNEPARHTGGKNYLPLARKLIAAIRAVDPTRFIMADGNGFASTPVPELYAVPALGQAFRGYAPLVLTHYKTTYMDLPNDKPLTWPLAPGYGTGWQRVLPEEALAKMRPALQAGEYCMIGEFGCHQKTPHNVVLAWMRHCLKLWKENDLGWALWNLRGNFGILDSGRIDVVYEDFHGHRLDRKMLDVLRAF